MKKAVVFDCDGTLIASMGIVQEVLALALSKILDRSVTLKEVLEKYDSKLEQLNKNFHLTTEQIAELQVVWSEMSLSSAYSYQLFPGIKQLLETLKEQDFSLYVWTARDRYSTIEILKKLNVLHYFLDLKTATDAEIKPHPAGLISMLPDFNPKDVLVVGDSYTDILGAKHFGAKAIGALWCPSAKADVLKEMGAFRLAKTPKDCYHHILEWMEIK